MFTMFIEDLLYTRIQGHRHKIMLVFEQVEVQQWRCAYEEVHIIDINVIATCAQHKRMSKESIAHSALGQGIGPNGQPEKVTFELNLNSVGKVGRAAQGVHCPADLGVPLLPLLFLYVSHPYPRTQMKSMFVERIFLDQHCRDRH